MEFAVTELVFEVLHFRASKHDNAVNICNRTMFGFYPELPQPCSQLPRSQARKGLKPPVLTPYGPGNEARVATAVRAWFDTKNSLLPLSLSLSL